MSALEADDRFGSAIAYSGERLAIGAAGDDGINNHRRNSGAVYLFDVPGGSTSQISFNSMIGRGYQEENTSGARSTGVADLGGLDTFGASVAMDGTRLIVGAPNDDGESNSTSNVGKVYTFALEDGAQTALNKVNIIGDSHFGDGTALSLDAGDKLGMSVSIDQGRIMIGAEGDDGATNRVQDAGAVYLYSTGFDGLGDIRLEGIIGDGYVGGKNVNLTDLQAGDRFGAGVSLDGARLAVGAPGDDGGLNDNPDTGIVYLFTFNNSLFGNGTLDRTLGGDVRRRVDFQGNVSFGPIDRENFGTSCALQDNLLFVGLPGRGFGGSVAAFSFNFNEFVIEPFGSPFSLGLLGDNIPQNGSQPANRQINLDNGDAFGSSVAFDGTRLLVGAPGDDGAGNALVRAGAAYHISFSHFELDDPVLNDVIGAGYDGLTLSGRPNTNVEGLRSGDLFGRSVAIDGGQVAIGAAGDDGNRNFYAESGAVYLYSFQQGNFFNLKRSNHTIGSNYESVQSFKSGARTTTGVSVDGVRFSDRFGSSIALDGDKLVVGAFGSDGRVRFQSLLTDERGPGGISQGRDSGSVFLMTLAKDNPLGRATLSGRLGLGWEGRFNPPSLQESSLTVRAGAGDAFGRSVALDGDTLIVGAPGADGFGPATSGSGEVFRFTFAGDDYRGVELSVLTHAMSAW